MSPARISVVAALALLGACRSGPPPAIDPALAELIPPEATILAGVNLGHLRASPLRQQFPAAVSALLDSLAAAQSVLIASDGTRYLVLTRGAAPTGATALGRGLAGSGSADWLRAAASPHSGGRNVLLPRAEPIAASADIWIAAAGNANLPVSGNGENLNNLLHSTQYATLSVRLADSVALEANGMCSGAEPARHLEETVRAFVSIGAGATARQPGLSGLLRRVRVTRDGRTIHVNLAVEAVELTAVLKLFGVGS